MRRVILALALALLSGAAGPAGAGPKDGALVRLLTLDEARPWAAVGRVNVEGAGFCTGTLIAPDRVLTAAHCLFHPRSGRPVTADRIHFLAGYRQGTPLAHRRVRRYVIHSEYRRNEGDRETQLRADVAVLELDQPVAASVVQPFERADRPRTGDPVTLVSYAKERAEVPSIQEPCHVLARRGRVMLLSCDVNYGASGAPVFVRGTDRPRIAALISAMAEWEGRPVAVSIELGQTLDEVLATLSTTDPNFRTIRPALTEEAGALVRSPEPGFRKVSRPPQP